MIEAIGWIGSMAFAICAFPQCYKTYKTKSTKDLSWLMLILWLIGGVFSFIYVLSMNLDMGEYQFPLLVNYIFSSSCNIHLIGSKVIYEKKTKL